MLVADDALSFALWIKTWVELVCMRCMLDFPNSTKKQWFFPSLSGPKNPLKASFWACRTKIFIFQLECVIFGDFPLRYGKNVMCPGTPLICHSCGLNWMSFQSDCRFWKLRSNAFCGNHFCHNATTSSLEKSHSSWKIMIFVRHAEKLDFEGFFGTSRGGVKNHSFFVLFVGNPNMHMHTNSTPVLVRSAKLNASLNSMSRTCCCAYVALAFTNV